MKKLRSDSKWNRLPPKQREQVLNWLFDDGLGYAAVLKRVKKQFGLKASLSSLRRFYHHVSDERSAGLLALAQGGPEDFRAATNKLLGVAALALDFGEGGAKALKQLLPVAKVLLKDKQQDTAIKRLQFQAKKHGLSL